MIGFIKAFVLQSLLITINTELLLIYTLSQFTVAHALGLSVSTSRTLATDLNTGPIISNHYEVFLSFLIPSLPTHQNSTQFSNSICTLLHSHSLGS
jgi:hypothetical protein